MSQTMPKFVRCYAEGRGSEWEAFCLDFDLAVQGDSLEDVVKSLHEQINLYVEGVLELPAADQRRLFARRAPLRSWMRPLWFTCLAILLGARRKASGVFDYPVETCPATA